MTSMGLLDKDDAVLVVVDVQDTLLKYVQDWERVLETIKKTVQIANIFGIPVIFTEQYPKGLGFTNGSLKAQAKEWHPVEKGVHFSCCKEPEFMDRLSALSKKQVAICGIEAHVCVNQTCHELLEKGFDVYVISDGCSSRSKLDYEIGLRSMERAGAEISCMERFLFEAARKAGSPEFKEAQQLIK